MLRTWTDLAEDRSLTVGVRRIRVEPGKWATPLHLEGNEEEIFFVLAGDGVSLQWDGEQEEAVRGARRETASFTFRSTTRTRSRRDRMESTCSPSGSAPSRPTRSYRAPACPWLGPTWVLQGATDDHPWTREAAVGPPDGRRPSLDRPQRIVNVDDLESVRHVTGATVSHRGRRDLGRAAGSVRTGLKLYDVAPGMLMDPPHSHSAEEEIFVVLAGDGDVELWPHPRSATEPARFSAMHETFAVKAGSTVCLRAGPGGRPRSGRVGGVCASSPTARAIPTTSASTRGRGRSACVASV